MFERFTDQARRTIFFARYESIQRDSSEITTEHLLLALFREGMSSDLLPAEPLAAIRREIEEEHPRSDKIHPSNADLPLSHSAKRVLAYASEEAERMKHGWIGSEHLLIGLLREPSPASRILEKNGVELDPLRTRFGALTAPPGIAPLSPEQAKAARDQLGALINTLPDSALAHAHGALFHLQHSQLRAPIDPPRTSEARAQLRQRLREAGDSAAGFVGGGSMAASMRIEGRITIFETSRFYQGHEITIVERIELAHDGKTLRYSQQILGPKNQERTCAVDFDV